MVIVLMRMFQVVLNHDESSRCARGSGRSSLASQINGGAQVLRSLPVAHPMRELTAHARPRMIRWRSSTALEFMDGCESCSNPNLIAFGNFKIPAVIATNPTFGMVDTRLSGRPKCP